MKRTLTILLVLIGCFIFSQGVKLRVAVSQFEDRTNNWGHWEIGKGLSDMLITALMESGKFTVIEREQMDKILQEQKLSQTGMITPQTSVQLGQMLGVPYLITGAVTEFINIESSGRTGVSFRGKSIGVKTYHGKVVVDIRIYDVSTGEIIFSKRAEGENSGSGIDFSVWKGPIKFSTSQVQKTPIGTAARLAIDQAVYHISDQIGSGKWQGRVVTVKDGMVYINAGSNVGLKEGAEFVVEKQGEELVDPDTGISLGSVNQYIGKIKIVKVEEKFSICEILTGQGYDKGQLVKTSDE